MAFSKNTLDFLFENKLHDSRTWFAEHREQYQEYVISPMRQLVQALEPTMLKLDPEFITEPKVGKTISRIWRDTRYSKDPSIYRDNMWIVFRKRSSKLQAECPGFYIDISGAGLSYGCGFYQASTGYMETMRTMILESHPSFKKALAAYRKQKVFVLEGDLYKRPHFPHQPPELQDWLERRGISLNTHSSDFSLLFSDNLAEHIIQDFTQIFPIYRFLRATADREQERKIQQQLAQR